MNAPPGNAAGTTLKGFCMGAADVVPGVSGGTIAYILGIYPQLLTAINSFDGMWLSQLLRFQFRAAAARPHFRFVLPLAAGIALALFTFTRIIPIPRLLYTHPEAVYGLFCGLVSGSIIVLQRRIRLASIRQFSLMVLGALLGWIAMTAAPSATPDTPLFAFLAGALAICAMILPGISGSFTLLVLGKYVYIFESLGRFDLTVIIPFGIGAILGLASFSRLLSYLLAKWQNGSMLVINGILVASLWIIWPFQLREYADSGSKLLRSTPFLPSEIDITVLSSGALALCGFATVLAIHFVAERH